MNAHIEIHYFPVDLREAKCSLANISITCMKWMGICSAMGRKISLASGSKCAIEELCFDKYICDMVLRRFQGNAFFDRDCIFVVVRPETAVAVYWLL